IYIILVFYICVSSFIAYKKLRP
ncbi:hypothetical protein Zm00014a_026555, partial [Zea mays]